MLPVEASVTVSSPPQTACALFLPPLYLPAGCLATPLKFTLELVDLLPCSLSLPPFLTLARLLLGAASNSLARIADR